MSEAQNNSVPVAAQPPVNPSDKKQKRKKALLTLAAIVIVGGVGLVGYEWLVGSHYESTDNAYVQGNVVQITPQIGGTVQAIMAEDTNFVKAGQPLVQLDAADARLALAQAEANLAQAVRQVRTLYANNGSLAAQVKLRQADVERARSEVARATDDLKRRQALAGNGAVSGEELQHAQAQLNNARSAMAAAEAGVIAAREQLVSNQAMTEGTSVEQHPSVQAAAARVREAWLTSQRLTLPAPVDGYIARRTVQLGQRVAAGTALMSVVPLQQVWVDGNFKEVQLRHIRIGQPVKLTADVYGKKVEYHGTVQGMGAGTGSAFALLPAQNATGNWIKVVQRVPVRIALDPQEIIRSPLRVGLSMDVEVDVRNQSGKMLADAAAGDAVKTQVFDSSSQQAEDEVRRVIAANLGGKAMAEAKAPAGAAAAASPAVANPGVPARLAASSGLSTGTH